MKTRELIGELTHALGELHRFVRAEQAKDPNRHLLHPAADAKIAALIAEGLTQADEGPGAAHAAEASVQVVVYEGFLQTDGALIQVDFEAPKGASKAELDSAFVAGLAQQVKLDYLAVGDMAGEAVAYEADDGSLSEAALAALRAEAAKSLPAGAIVRRASLFDLQPHGVEGASSAPAP